MDEKTKALERERAMAVVERYFDVDLETQDSVVDMLLDNGIEGTVAAEVAREIYPEESDGGLGSKI